MSNYDRRRFLKAAATGSLIASGGGALGLPQLQAVPNQDLVLSQEHVKFSSDIEPLVKLLETTPREQVVLEFGGRIRDGKISYREALAALFLAAIRNVEPRPSVGFKFHTVLVVNSCHLASLASPSQDRWLPILWAVDNFKSAQARDVREGDWTMAPVREELVPSPLQAQACFREAMDSWDEEKADYATVGLVRAYSTNHVFEEFARYAARDFRSIGHKAIFLANAYRTLNCIGWQYAEPVMRSLAYALLNHVGEPNPSSHDLMPDRDWRENEKLAAELPKDWCWGTKQEGGVETLLESLRDASSRMVATETARLLRDGHSLQTVQDGLFLGASELLMRQPGIVGLHTLTTTNAMQYLFRTCQDDAIRRRLLIQNACMLSRFRSEMESRGKLSPHTLSSLAETPETPIKEVGELFERMSEDRLDAARSALQHLSQDHARSSKRFTDHARRLVFATGNDSHDYKYSSAILEDHAQLSDRFKSTYLAAAIFQLPDAKQRVQPIVEQVREVFG